MRWRLLILIFFLVPTAGLAQWQDLAEIRAAALDFAQRQTSELPGSVEIQVGEVDTRLRLTHCAALETFLPPAAKLWGKSTVGVRCQRPEAWSVYIPVTVKVMAQVVVTAKPLPPGHTLRAADLLLQSADLTRLPPGVFTRIEQAVDKIVVAGLPAESRLQASMLRTPYAVRQGQMVQLLYRSGNFQVSGQGKALANAIAGEVVQIQANSGKILSGIAQPGGIVEIR